ncbi:hypothetical protein MesoLjLc_38460 [Mesorhizobium sp. L-8-10]|uniref:DUF4169 family protein n=1 Tax=unclassified Mesorhizobium TaxID=325217 RepID=UPI0019258665|nr:MULTISPECIES: DUF4169 family protein [unclassified Mesorhizobium]BCH24183.1 hypothetical protein MesoLjLb_39680 [Mesorhizobium sp. L-8-3]BCH31916.1 hypothetical protein MesoLjLc_38460 [Mesorhizobium sp. L-8-10]
MAEIVNLRMARKRKTRDEKERLAQQNRQLHGRSKAEKLRSETEAGRSSAFLDGHRLARKDEDTHG